MWKNIEIRQLSRSALHVFKGTEATSVPLCGTHTCPVRSKNVEKPAKNVQEILKKDPSLKPSEVQSAMIVPMLRGKNDWEKIDKQVTQLIDRSRISRQKRTVRREINPMGHYGRKFRGVGYI